jgi:peptidoglycan/xylan/chitin deacetylase (PgdA/CDA1 family)
VGAHSVTHGFLTQCQPEALSREVQEPQETIYRELGGTLAESFAYPQGDYNARVVAEVMSSGYTTAVTVDQGRATSKSKPLTLPRLLVSGNTTPTMMRAFSVPTIGPAYQLLNFAIKRMLRRKKWPRRNPSEVDSTQSVEVPET